MLPVIAVSLAFLLAAAYAQQPNCDFAADVHPGTTYYVYSPKYPARFPNNTVCRWIGRCPSGYNCRLFCPDVTLVPSRDCSVDRLLVSKTGDPQLANADVYCDSGQLTAVSRDRAISVGLVVADNSPGGRFYCELTAQPATPTPSQCRCGYKKSNRIVGGQETGINEYPMLAGIVDVDISQIKCGAVIISTRALASAAHCVAKRTIDNTAVVVGEHDVSTGVDTSAAQAHRISKFIIHPRYNPSNYDYDATLVVTQTEIVFNDRVGPVCLPFKFTNTDFTNKYVTLLGWGTQSFGGPTSNVPLKVDVQVISQSYCRQMVPAVTDRQICTFTPGKDACQDDSGGPMLYTDPSTGLLFSFGIISYGRSCASGDPGINTRVTEILGWIVNNAPAYDYCRK